MQIRKVELGENIKYNLSIIELLKQYPAKQSRRTSNTRAITPKIRLSNIEQPNCFIVSGSKGKAVEYAARQTAIKN